MVSKALHHLLVKASQAYYRGLPIMEDEVFDTLAEQYNYEGLGAEDDSNEVVHAYPMYSLTKVYDGDEYNISYSKEEWVETPKLDGAAIEVSYFNGSLFSAATRGDGVKGIDITDKIRSAGGIGVPHFLEASKGLVQVSGEIVVIDKTIPNSRNYASGSLAQKNNAVWEEKAKNLIFAAYSIQSEEPTATYLEDMEKLEKLGFNPITQAQFLEDRFPKDGKVFRLNSNEEYLKLGHTARHPRGAYARKQSSDVEVKETVLRNVTWQLGHTGKVTPVAHFDTIIIDDANINKATLHNAGFIEELDLYIGDTLLVTRSGGIIPKVIGKL